MKRALLPGVATAMLLGAPPAQATLAYVTAASTSRPVVHVAADDGSGARVLVRGGHHPQVSPDGQMVAYLSGTQRVRLQVRPAAGGPARTLARSVWNLEAVRWSPDGARLAVITGPELGPYALRLVDAADGSSRVLHRGSFHGVSFAPDSTAVVWSRSARVDRPIVADLYRAELGGGEIARLTTDGKAIEPVWGPERIAFARRSRPARRGDHDKLDLFTIAPDGSARRRLTRTQPPFQVAGLSPLAWSPDGRRLLARWGGKGTSEAWRVDARSGSAADLTGKDDGVVPWGLSRDGTTVLATTGGPDTPNGSVVAVDWESGSKTVLARRATQPSTSR